jgi:hypothetical protein
MSCRFNPCGPGPVPGQQTLVAVKEEEMDQDRKTDDLPHRDREHLDEIEGEARKSRKDLDSVPPPGTDPLHEGP